MATTSFLIKKIDDSSLDALVGELCQIETVNGRFIVQIPVVTSTGSTVSVTIWPEGGSRTFLVTDDGLAHREVANALASDRVFVRTAVAKCSRYGASFDGGSMLLMRVTRERLKGAVIAMAALIKEVVDETIEKSFSSRFDAAQETFVKNAAQAFREYQIKEHAIVYGQSTSAYNFDLIVKLGTHELAFQYFSRSGNSINSAFVAMSDVSRSEGAPKLVGVTQSISSVGPKLALISSVARVIEASAEPQVYKRLAA